ncbi:MAG: hypothetical protein KBB37_00310 [Bacteroidia bacterium]|nr:hypothetical protein [Bacteroidia bacterium]MBP7259701.1 hypothetical protein [Bacteroidia bacterium]MBP9179398.1 hypothetical protein [Bacteroidia bacterium]MBP9723348.1 hypothetical protein [Bacteroidia bacterium]
MAQLDELKKHLKRGKVYRRGDLTIWSKSVDRHLEQLVEEGTLEKLSQGLYYFPKETAFGKTPPEEDVLIASFLKDKRFLITSPNTYNSLGVGTTQLYNKRVVYNHKRHGEIKLGNRTFDFQVKHHFPNKVTEEFLLVDLVNNLEQLAEDQNEVLNKVLTKVSGLNSQKLKSSLEEYGNTRTKRLLQPLLSKSEQQYA